MTDTPVDELSELRTAYADGLAELSTFVLNRPELFSQTTLEYGGVGVALFVDADELPDKLRRLGPFHKYATDWAIGGERSFGPHTLRVVAYRTEVCEKVPTGEKVVREGVVAEDGSVPEGATNVRTVTKTTTEVLYDIIEDKTKWSCPDSLLAPHD